MTKAEEKRIFRTQAQSALASMPDAERRAASDKIQAGVVGLAEYSNCEQVFCYLSFGKEVSTDLIVEEAWRSGKVLVVPVFRSGSYRLVEYRREDELVQGHYGIMEPLSNDAAQIRGYVLAVVPGMAYDRSCQRLGRGGGYYDRMLGQLASGAARLFCAGVTYSSTLFEKVPTEAHDFSVDVVITEKETVHRPKV